MSFQRKKVQILFVIATGLIACYACTRVAKTRDRAVHQDAEIIIGPEPPMRR